jgi:hypothetical protein
MIVHVCLPLASMDEQIPGNHSYMPIFYTLDTYMGFCIYFKLLFHLSHHWIAV